VRSRSSITHSRRQTALIAALATLGLGLAGCASSPSALTPGGPAAADIANLWWIMFVVAAVVFVIVIALLLIALLRRNADRSQALGDGRKLVAACVATLLP
jgi:cytochrome c oxidase subunit II